MQCYFGISETSAFVVAMYSLFAPARRSLHKLNSLKFNIQLYWYAGNATCVDTLAWGALQCGPGMLHQNIGCMGHNVFGPTKRWHICLLILAVVN